MVLIIFLLALLVLPTAAVFGAWNLVDWLRDARKIETTERDRRDRDARYARILRG